MRSFFEFDVPSIDGHPDLLGPLRGKVVLAANVASRCGLTPRYSGFEELHEELAAENFSVVGFLCNQSGGQQPASGFPGDIQWNFEKFLIGRDGRVIRRYPPTTKPRDNGLMQDIAEAL